MSHELFVIDYKQELDEQDRERVNHLRESLLGAESLDLQAQAARIRVDIATIERGSLITTLPMTDAELVIWRAWLPAVYTDGRGTGHFQLARYDFDRIPQPVLKLWQRHKESEAFERFEIWTPEQQQPDPILVGVNGNARHLLARWSESDANLVSFEDIKRELVRRWHNNEDIREEEFYKRSSRTISAMGAALISILVVLCAMLAMDKKEMSDLLIAVVPLVTIAAGTFIYVRRLLTRRCLASSRLMQAIAKDDLVRRESFISV